MSERNSEEHKLWLFDLAHGSLSEAKVLEGFIKYYALCGLTMGNVLDDIVFRTHYQPEDAVEKLKEILTKVSEGRKLDDTDKKEYEFEKIIHNNKKIRR